ncbi:Hypothetical predicted protein [Podarcis lilfordi]|uniref:Uncharacterized protein n=1 Tax=Podarcis lilfordi TaxID=74358 RepID=A0AA35NWC4_9SAUR|nr:Hypothetical predicted protein [Podarcis lilfordi]
MGWPRPPPSSAAFPAAAAASSSYSGHLPTRKRPAPQRRKRPIDSANRKAQTERGGDTSSVKKELEGGGCEEVARVGLGGAKGPPQTRGRAEGPSSRVRGWRGGRGLLDSEAVGNTIVCV